MYKPNAAMHQENRIALPDRLTTNNASRLSPDIMYLHLLNRALNGFSFSQYMVWKDKPLAAVVKGLLESPLTISRPLKDYTTINASIPDINIKTGSTWVEDNNYDYEVNLKRKQSLRKWLMGILYGQELSVRPKMILFWHNFFPFQLQRISLASKAYEYFSTIINYSLESFRELLLHQVTSFALLEYHKKIKPERESLYKFHAGRILSNYLFGEDYATIISKDRMKRYARLISEWNLINDNLVLSATKMSAEVKVPSRVTFNPHNLPGHFMEKPVVRGFLTELDEFNGRLLQYKKIAMRLSEKLFRWFVHYETETVQARKIIQLMATTALESNYDIRKMLSVLFLHESFYDAQYVGSMIKSPVKFLFGISKELDLVSSVNMNSLAEYPAMDWMLTQIDRLGQSREEFPGLQQWPAFENIPGKEWLNSEIALERAELVSMVNRQESLPAYQFVRSDIFAILEKMIDVRDLDVIMDFMIRFFSSTIHVKEKKNNFRNHVHTIIQVTYEEWKTLTTQVMENRDETSRQKADEIIRQMVRYFQYAPEYNFC